ncbi:hypothetical protein BCY84_15701 [Trypanosoma cruzi cruzi]|nr:hypothetical protein BCY84_15701 [Trypanosoma cruzi cruzi]
MREPITARRISFIFFLFLPSTLFDSDLAVESCGWRTQSVLTRKQQISPIRTQRTVPRGWLSEHIDVVGTNFGDVARPLPLHDPLLSRPIFFMYKASGSGPQPRRIFGGEYLRVCVCV